MRSLPGPDTGLPLARIWPLPGKSSPAIRLSSVLLPHPDGPTRQTNSPSCTLSDTLSSACTSPLEVLKCLETPSTTSLGGAVVSSNCSLVSVVTDFYSSKYRWHPMEFSLSALRGATSGRRCARGRASASRTQSGAHLPLILATTR